ncbi:hypothetical protein LIA77_02655 [Sarocladium implicatum]|nr:hypothetical protein LIA77_02655 [Sarocladium implicatum]
MHPVHPGRRGSSLGIAYRTTVLEEANIPVVACSRSRDSSRSRRESCIEAGVGSFQINHALPCRGRRSRVMRARGSCLLRTVPWTLDAVKRSFHCTESTL